MFLPTTTRRLAAASAAALAVLAGGLAAPSPVAATTVLSQQVTGTATGSEQKEWFNTAFDTEPRLFGRVRGRVRFMTDTTAHLDSTRTISSTDRGVLDAGQTILTRLRNDNHSSRLRVTAEPRLQMLVEWQPPGDSLVCDNTTFPTFDGNEWFKRTDGGGDASDGFCGAIEVTADDLNTIASDLEIPRVFTLLDQQFTPAYGGTQQLAQSSQLLEIKVCKIATFAFNAPIGDRCDLQLNAQTGAPLTTLGHTLKAQMCTDGKVLGQDDACVQRFGVERALTFTPDAIESFSAKAPCPGRTTDVDVAISDPVWQARLDSVTVGLSVDFNVHLRRDGDGKDVLTVPVPGSISLLSDALPLRVAHAPAGVPLHVADVTPDNDPPVVHLNPADVTIDEGSSATFAPSMIDLCTPTADLSSMWTIDGTNLAGPTLTRGYDNDKPTPLHQGALAVSDERGNPAPSVPFSVTVRNVAPSVQLSAPGQPVPIGTAAPFSSQVTDPGADLMTWQWTFGDGATASRTATSVEDRTDGRTHTYSRPGLYTPEVRVGDGTDERSRSSAVIAFDPLDRLAGSGTFTADASSINVPVGSTYSVSANLSYARGAVRPSGPFTADFRIARPFGHSEPARLVGGSYEWLFDYGSHARAQGVGTLNGEPGWKFLLEASRDARSPQTTRLTVSVWRIGFGSAADPDYRFGGVRDTGNIV